MHDSASISTSNVVVEGKTAESAPVESSRKNSSAPEVDTDPTLYPDEYEARGLPSVQNPWSLNDYQTAVPVLIALANEKPALLPRAGSKHSGAVFQRIVSRENLQLYAGGDTRASIRLMRSQEMLEVYMNLLRIYGQTLVHGQPHDREFLEMYVLIGHASISMWRIVDEVAPAVLRDAARRSQFLNGMHDMEVGSAGLMRAMLMAIQDRQVVAMKNHIWFAAELRAFMPEVISRLESADQAELKGKIAQLAASEPEPELAKQLKLLRDAIAQAKQPLVPRAENISTAIP